jgi:hypothetical protein
MDDGWCIFKVRMMTGLHKWMAFGLVVLFVCLAMPSVSAAHSSLPPCHHSAPVPNSHGSNPDHVCCAVGHNQILPSSRVESPNLQLGNVIKHAVMPQAYTTTGPLHSTVTDSGPPLRNISPIRI